MFWELQSFSYLAGDITSYFLKVSHHNFLTIPAFNNITAIISFKFVVLRIINFYITTMKRKFDHFSHANFYYILRDSFKKYFTSPEISFFQEKSQSLWIFFASVSILKFKGTDKIIFELWKNKSFLSVLLWNCILKMVIRCCTVIYIIFMLCVKIFYASVLKVHNRSVKNTSSIF